MGNDKTDEALLKIMNKQKAYADVLRERAQDLRTLIEYFCTTRVIRSKYYQDRLGGFSLTKFYNQRTMLNSWNNPKTPQRYRDKNAAKYAIYQKQYNEVLGIPHDLLNDILGQYAPTRKWISLDDALGVIGGRSAWKVIEHGQRAYTDKETGVRVVKDAFKRKIYPELPYIWNKMLHDYRYARLDTIPNASERAIEIIRAWELAQDFTELVKEHGKKVLPAIEEGMRSRMLPPKFVKRVITMLNRVK
ncbi:MAG: hypothetical protein IIZ78_29515 [Clostridiales bacterium]|nr:hypothetical protein [Clostridiales bacterium]MBQ1575292.1 hypothetical protein [Clostridiales bacterium]